MKKIYITISISLISILLNAQSESINKDELVLKVKLVKPIENSEFCKTANPLKDAVVLEFDVVNEVDIEKFGSKIYAIAICDEFPSERMFDSKYIFDLEISEKQNYCWDIKIINEELLDRNRNKTKFWIRGISRKVICYCGQISK